MSDLEFLGHAGPDFARLSRKFTMRTWNPHARLFAEAEAPQLLHLDKGAVAVAGQQILAPRFIGDTLSWVQKTEQHGFSSGLLHFTRDRMAFAGQVFTGADERTATAQDVTGAVPPTIFDTVISANPLPAGDGGQTTGVTVTFGYTFDHPGSQPSPLLEFNDEPATKDCTAIGVDAATDKLQITAFFNPTLTKQSAEFYPQWPAGAAVDIADDGMSFDGWMAYYDADADDAGKAHYRWSGTARPSVAPQALAVNPFAAPKPTAMEISDLSLAELITIQPSAAELQKSAFTLLVENLKYAMDETLLDEFFGEKKPDLSRDPARAASITEAADFYNNRFGPGYFGYSFGQISGDTAPSNQISAAEVQLLDDYLNGGIAFEKQYSAQNQGLVVTAFIMNAPRLQNYLDDGAAKWAQQVSDSVSSAPQLNVAINRIMATHSMEVVKNTATLLLSLQPTGELSNQYHKLVLSRMMLEMGQSAKFDQPKDGDTWIEDFFTEFLKQYLHAPEDGTAKTRTLRALAEDLEEASEKIGGITDLAGAFGEALESLITWNSDKIEQAETSLMQKVGKAARALKFLALAGGTLFSIMGFLNWDKLSDTAKARVIISAIATTGALVDGVPALITFGKKFTLTDLVDINNIFDNDTASIPYQTLDEIFEDLPEEDADWVSIGAGKVMGTFDRSGKEIIVDGTDWAVRFKNATRFLKWLGPAVSAAFAAVSWVDFSNGLGDKSTEDKAFQGIIASAQTLETLILVADVMAGAECIPFAGPVLALIGIVFTLVEAFMPHPRPQSPVEAYLDSAVRPFLKTLPMTALA